MCCGYLCLHKKRDLDILYHQASLLSLFVTHCLFISPHNMPTERSLMYKIPLQLIISSSSFCSSSGWCFIVFYLNSEGIVGNEVVVIPVRPTYPISPGTKRPT